MSTPTEDFLSDPQNQQLMVYAGTLIVGMLVLKAFLNALSSGIVLLPILYLFLAATCPPASSFDAKKEIKRVLRGHHLPENHPDKPKGYFNETFARLTATLTTEVATAAGYEVTSVPMAHCVIWNTVRVPSAKMDFYWVGAANRWWFVHSAEYGRAKDD